MQKTRFSGVLATFVLCMGFWILLTWNFSVQELAAGAIVSFFVALFSSRFFIHENAFWLFHPGRLLNLIYYVLIVFPVELIKANVDVAKRCFGGCKNVNPGVIRVPVDLKSSYGQSMLASSITLTPGTISLDIAEDEDNGQVYYYIHWIDVATTDPEKAGEMIKGRMEKTIRRIWK